MTSQHFDGRVSYREGRKERRKEGRKRKEKRKKNYASLGTKKVFRFSVFAFGRFFFSLIRYGRLPVMTVIAVVVNNYDRL